MYLDHGFENVLLRFFVFLWGFLGILSNSLLSVTQCQYLGRKFFWETQNADI